MKWNMRFLDHNRGNMVDLIQHIEYLERMEEAVQLPPLLAKEISNIRGEIKEVYKRKIYRRQRSWEWWLKEGDTNTSSFHKLANMRRRINTIHSLISEQGTL